MTTSELKKALAAQFGGKASEYYVSKFSEKQPIAWGGGTLEGIEISSVTNFQRTLEGLEKVREFAEKLTNLKVYVN